MDGGEQQSLLLSPRDTNRQRDAGGVPIGLAVISAAVLNQPSERSDSSLERLKEGPAVLSIRCLALSWNDDFFFEYILFFFLLKKNKERTYLESPVIILPLLDRQQ